MENEELARSSGKFPTWNLGTAYNLEFRSQLSLNVAPSNVAVTRKVACLILLDSKYLKKPFSGPKIVYDSQKPRELTLAPTEAELGTAQP